MGIAVGKVAWRLGEGRRSRERDVAPWESRTSSPIYGALLDEAITYDHRHWKTRDPVRSPLDKPAIARLVVGWVTTSESLVLYVFSSFFSFRGLFLG